MTRAAIHDQGTRYVLPRGRTRSRIAVQHKARWLEPLATPLLLSLALLAQGCGKRPSHDECEALLDHYVELLVASDRPGTSAAELHKLQLQAREKAKDDPQFAACPERVSRRELDCAMKAANADLLEQCLL